MTTARAAIALIVLCSATAIDLGASVGFASFADLSRLHLGLLPNAGGLRLGVANNLGGPVLGLSHHTTHRLGRLCGQVVGLLSGAHARKRNRA